MRQVRWLSLVGVLLAGIFLSWTVVAVRAAVTPEQKKELNEIKKDLGKVKGHLTKKEFDEAKKVLDESQSKLKKIADDSKMMETEGALAPVHVMLIQRRAELDKKLGATGMGGVDFDKEVAPILAAKCVSCHGDEKSSAGLKLDSFANVEIASGTKRLVIPGQADASLLVARITATDEQKMPKGEKTLSGEEIATIVSWINQGAKFKGDKAAKFVAGAKPGAARPANGPAPTIARATGNEKVSFIKDIAPWMVNLCGNCHGGANPRGGLSLATFEGLMRGGASGRVILPDNREGSRLWRLVGGIELPRMPQGQARITRKNYEDLKTWLDEGAKFDGPDPKVPLRQLVPTEEERLAAELAKLSHEEFVTRRKEISEDQWKRANPSEEYKMLESDDFLVYGNVSEVRLKEIQDWSEEHAKTLRSVFNVNGAALWRGKLAVFVFKDRFTYEEFPRVIESAEVPKETVGHARVVRSFADAYICVQDIGDQVTTDSPGMKLNVVDQITGAFLKRTGDKVPDWLIRGLGLALAAGNDKKNEYIKNLPTMAMDSLKTIESPEQIFEKGKFSSADLGPIGYTLVKHILIEGGPKKLGMLVEKMQGGMEQEAATKAVYSADLKGLGTSYLASLGAGNTKKPTKVKKK
ncbi:MAG: Planctomycete cytochrome [Planctomycetaceae bacterium]|nr:Planctomycete cytochrome [Planctomycetaceae bacterium]